MNYFVGLISLEQRITIIALQDGKLKDIIHLTEGISLKHVHSAVRLPSALY